MLRSSKFRILLGIVAGLMLTTTASACGRAHRGYDFGYRGYDFGYRGGYSYRHHDYSFRNDKHRHRRDRDRHDGHHYRRQDHRRSWDGFRDAPRFRGFWRGRR